MHPFRHHVDASIAGSGIPGPVWGAWVGIAITAAVTLWRGRRTDKNEKAKTVAEAVKTSGSIESSDAGTLWDASEQIRHELRDEVDRLRGELTEVRAELVEVRDSCRSRIDHLEGVVTKLTDRLARQEKR